MICQLESCAICTVLGGLKTNHKCLPWWLYIYIHTYIESAMHMFFKFYQTDVDTLHMPNLWHIDIPSTARRASAANTPAPTATACGEMQLLTSSPALRAAPHGHYLVFERLPAALVLAPGLPGLFQRLRWSNASANSWGTTGLITSKYVEARRRRMSVLRDTDLLEQHVRLPLHLTDLLHGHAVPLVDPREAQPVACQEQRPLPLHERNTHCIRNPLDEEKRDLWTSEHCAGLLLLGWQMQTDWWTGQVLLFIQRMPIYRQGVMYRHTAMTQSSSRSLRPHMGASMVTSLYVVITGRLESCREQHKSLDSSRRLLNGNIVHWALAHILIEKSVSVLLHTIHPFRRGPRSVRCDLKVVRSIFGAAITLLQ